MILELNIHVDLPNYQITKYGHVLGANVAGKAVEPKNRRVFGIKKTKGKIKATITLMICNGRFTS